MNAVRKKEYFFIDVFKLLFAISMILRHTNVFVGTQLFGLVSNTIYSPSVPFFFVASGFFCGKTYNRCGEDSVFLPKKYLFRLAKKLLFFECVNIIIVAIRYYVDGRGVDEFVLHTVRSVLFYPYGALWYLQAVIIAVILLAITIQIGWINMILPIGIVLYLIACTGNNYFFLIQGTKLELLHDVLIKIIASLRNGVFYGYYFVGTGLMISINWEHLSEKKIQRWIMFVFAVLLYIIELIFLKGRSYRDDRSLYISFIILIPLFFIIIAQIEFCAGFNSVILRNLSTSIYLVHSPIISIVDICLIIMGVCVNKTIETIIVVIIITLILYLVYYFKPRIVYKLLT